MAGLRKPYTGVWNIIRFNWHMFVTALIIILGSAFLAEYISKPYNNYIWIISGLLSITTCITIAVSFYIYDCSSLYKLDWLNDHINPTGNIVNIHAGFDETSELLINKYPEIRLTILDFYDPVKHTEPSIRRARKFHP